MFQFSKEQVMKLEALHSRARFKHRHDNETGDTTICVIRDVHMGKDWVQAEVPGTGTEAEKAALDAVILKAQPDGRPLTPAEMASRLAAYEQKYGDLDAGKPAKAAKATA